MSEEHKADTPQRSNSSSNDEYQREAANSIRLPFPVVGVGASAGGLGAVTALLENTPAECGMAFIVILHLSPNHHSSSDLILQRATRMPVLQVTEEQKIQKNHVYVIPPNKLLTMQDGHLSVSDLVRPRGTHVAIDLFFRTLAEVHQERAFAIVLSGTGSDGTQGLKRIKETGGVTFAQSPADAEFDGMPLSAIATGVVDIVLPVVDIPQKLMELWASSVRIELPPSTQDEPFASQHSASVSAAEAGEMALQRITSLLLERTGHDFKNYKRATVLRRIERRMQVNALSTLPDYADFLETHTGETGPLLQDLLISVTNFFRDREAFDAIQRQLMSTLFAQRPLPQNVRAWVAGCATGEEAYSIAMILNENAVNNGRVPALQVFATDIDEKAVGMARAGVYPGSIVTDVPSLRLRQFFSNEQGRYRVLKSLRENVLFAMHNALRDPPFSRLDLVCCRNLLIYLERDVQQRLLETFHHALHPNGLLFLGMSETADAAPEYFTVVDKKHRIYRANAVGRAVLRRASQVNAGILGHLAPQVFADSHGHRRLFSEIHHELLEEFAPASAMVDSELNVVHLSDRAGRFLLHRGGEPSRQILLLALPALRAPLRTALMHARGTNESVAARPVMVEREGRSLLVNISVRPVHDTRAGPNWLLVLFAESDVDVLKPAELQLGDSVLPSPYEQELERIHEELLGSIDESQSSTEQLRAANEELQAINEELRSATEELETSKEELQSVNEELVTVNYELKSKVEETAKINDDLQNLIASTDIATVFVDRAMTIKRFTPRAARVFNIIATDIGRSLLDLTHKLDYPHLAEDAANTFESLRQTEREVSSTDGKWYLVRVLPYRTVEDRIDGAVINCIDITARREAEDMLRTGEERMRLVAETTRDYAIITLDPVGRITSWNVGAEHMFGFSEAEAIGQPIAMIFTPEDRLAGVPDHELAQAAEAGRAEDDRWHVRKDGSRFFCSGITTPLVGRKSRGFAKIARDLTTARLMEAQREALLKAEQSVREELQNASRLKDEFLAVMSHELKNPLNLIQLNAELLMRMPPPVDSTHVQRAAAAIRSSVASQAQIVNDLLDLSRLRTGKLSLHMAPFDVVPVVARIVQAVQDEAAAAGKTLTLDSIGLALVQGDAVRVEQIVWNLLSNALKFTPSGGSIDVRLANDGEFVRLVVADTGRGIPSEFLPDVFDMFSQADSRTTRGEGGLGVGLALVKLLTELHGGKAAVESEGLGRGARFSVSLPRTAGAVEGPVTASTISQGVAGLRILLVDDEPDTLEAFQLLMTLEGASVEVAGSADSALALVASSGNFDVVVSDVSMPGKDGYALVKEVRAAEQARGDGGKTFAIAVTGLARSGDRDRALRSGFDEHLSKPLDVRELLALMRRQFGRT